MLDRAAVRSIYIYKSVSFLACRLLAIAVFETDWDKQTADAETKTPTNTFVTDIRYYNFIPIFV